MEFKWAIFPLTVSKELTATWIAMIITICLPAPIITLLSYRKSEGVKGAAVFNRTADSNDDDNLGNCSGKQGLLLI